MPFVSIACFLVDAWDPRIKEFGMLVTRPLTNFKQAVNKLNDHFGSKGKKSHQVVVEMAVTFSAMMNKPSLAIDHQLSSQ